MKLKNLIRKNNLKFLKVEKNEKKSKKFQNLF